MKKFNKKGFTLIEMLVVIAIIAILVAVIVPTVSKSTEKAAAATNAANLRSMQAEAAIDMLSGAADSTGLVSFTPGENGGGTFEPLGTAPTSKKVGTCTAGATARIVLGDDGLVVATYNDYTVEDFAAAADSGTLGTASGGGQSGGQGGGGQSGEQGGGGQS